MEYFLENIAKSLQTEFGNSLNRHCLVFPNRRAGLYFMKYLAARIEKPVWAPLIYTINELFRSYSSLQTAGNEILLFELYKVYRKLKRSPESFDDFYFWGDMLINDFDDVDKYLVNVPLLFRNVLDIKNIDQQFGGLTEDQIEIVKKFWLNFNPDKPSKEKSGFINIWSVLNDLYSGFRSSMIKQNIAYEGMIFRELAENSEKELYQGMQLDMVHFIGFNALNECEKVVMKRFKKTGKARFYWDYDNSYIINGKLNSAGFFMRENLNIFGNDMPSGWSYDTMLSTVEPVIRRRVIETSSDVAQIKLISRLIEELPDLTRASAHHTAIILSDENLLMPVLTSLPEDIGDINITMGFPLKQTLVYTLLKHLMDLQRNSSVTEHLVRFSYKDVISILKHTLMTGLMSESDKEIISEITKTNLVWVPSDRFARYEHLSRVFIKPVTSALLSDYFKNILSLLVLTDEGTPNESVNSRVERNIRNEFIYRIVLSINRLEAIVDTPDVSFSTETYMRILDRMLRIQSVPFSGEPLSGIQIMGILETRALDFKNLIMLSVNEGVLPSVSSGSSFIPFSLREAFGLPSVNHQESIYAYHFYRLLQRAENVTFIYNSNSEGLKSGEMSRFLIQMKYDTVLKPDFLDLSFEIKTHGSIGERVERTEEHTGQLNSLFLDKSNRRILSPSAINTWLNCSMKFYYRYVNGLKETEVITRDIDPAMLGNILHDIMKNLYYEFISQVLTSDRLNSFISDKQLVKKIINNAVREKFNKGADSPIEGNESIVRDVLKAYVMKILRTDKSLTPFKILNLEDNFSFTLPLPSGDSQIEVLIGGKVDRIDVVGGGTRIVDYKTGSVADTINSVGDLFVNDRKKDSDGWLQTLIYCEAYLASNPEVCIRPSVYKIRKLTGASPADKLRLKTNSKNEIIIDDYQTVRDDFINNLKIIVATILSKKEPFTMTGDIRGKCSYCPYKALCIR